MSKELLQAIIDVGVSKESLNSFFNSVSNNYSEKETPLSSSKDPRFSNLEMLGEIVFSPSQKLVVVSAQVSDNLSERSSKKAQYETAKRVLKDLLKYDAAIFVFYNNSGSFRFSLVYAQYVGTKINFSNFRRFTYFVDPAQTNKTFKDRVGLCPFASLDALKDAFSVEKVNKEFYKQIAQYYYMLTGRDGKTRQLVLPYVADDDDKKYEEFAVRLIGRSVFCWFLKHKKSEAGISLIPEKLLSVFAVKQNYYHFTLEPLFFEVMNTEINKRKPAVLSALPKSKDVPFLNGGLFEPHIHDYYPDAANFALKIPDSWFKEFFGLLEQYNFTIDENSTVDAEVSVDPEMMGRIFENLLAEVNPDTGETARKATGSYYTPRVIVDYMVGQSLKHYLLSKTRLDECHVSDLLDYEKDIEDWNNEEKEDVVKALSQIKIVDPACGSGAFPMGVLQRMILALEKVDPELIIWRRQYLDSIDTAFRKTVTESVSRENWDYLRKLIIIRESIYGVDIQEIAVEIAKLRCFLSLVVDEYVTDEPDKNRGIKPLPNLEFKFVAANSLIGLPKKEDLGMFEDQSSITALAKLRREYFTSYGEQKESIKKEFSEIQERMLGHYLKHVSTVKIDFTGTSKKQESTIDTQTQLLAKWKPFSNEPSSWFDPEWMFGIVGGFDVVIANPPYISAVTDSKNDANSRTYFRVKYGLKGSFDVYIVFLLRGQELIGSEGLYSWIIPNKFLVADYAEAPRQSLRQNGLFQVVSISNIDVFENTGVYPILIFGKKGSDDYAEFQVESLTDLTTGSLKKCSRTQNKHKTIADYGLKISSGTTGFQAQEIIKYISDEPNSRNIPFIVSGCIDRYCVSFEDVRYMKKTYSRAFIRNGNSIAHTKWQFWEQEKIVIAGMTKKIEAVYCDTPLALGVGVYAIHDYGGFSPKYLLGLLNSRYLTYYLLTHFQEKHLAGGYLAINKSTIEKLPLVKTTSELEKQLVMFVDQIIPLVRSEDYITNKTKQAKVKELEHQIDQLVYQLYGLTPEEIAMVEGKT